MLQAVTKNLNKKKKKEDMMKLLFSFQCPIDPSGDKRMEAELGNLSQNPTFDIKKKILLLDFSNDHVFIL